LRRQPLCAKPFGRADAGLDARSDRGGDLVLHLMHMLEASVILLRPDQAPTPRFDQMDRDPQLLAELTHPAFHDIVGAELPADLTDIAAAPFEAKRRVACDDQ